MTDFMFTDVVLATALFISGATISYVIYYIATGKIDEL